MICYGTALHKFLDNGAKCNRQSASQTAKITDFAVSPGSVTIHPIEMPANTKGLK